METLDEPSYSPPGLSLNRIQLTLVLIGIPILGLALAWYFSRAVPERPEARLQASIQVQVANWVPPNEDSSKVLLLPCVILTNESDSSWNNVAVSLDKQFFHYHYQPLPAKESVTIPLEHFVTKGGNVMFRPASQKYHKITVFAQIPSGERGVFEQEIE